MGKSPDAFRTISEVAALLETPTHVLRFWEQKFPQIKPVKGAGNRRYYRPDDIALLGGIKVLLHDQGVAIRGVQKLLKEQGPRHVASLSPMTSEELGGGVGEDADAWPAPGEAGAARGEASPPGGPAVADGATFVEAVLGRLVGAGSQPAPRGEASLARLRQLVAAADPQRLRERADRIAPLLRRLEALRDR